jgi:galactose mutarotase-like enzyme
MSADLVTIGSAALSGRINPLGAELWSLRDAAGAEYMTDADPAFWTGHAPVLFPIVGGLAGDKFRHQGREYHLPRHGFARRSLFALVEQSAEAVTFALEDDAASREVYPFAFRLELRHAVEGRTLRTTATVINTGNELLPFSLGYHHAFAWPLPGGAAKGAHKLVFSAQELADVRRLGADGLLLPEGQPTPVVGRELALDASLFVDDAMIWTDLASRSLAYGAQGGAWLDISFPDTPYLGLWQKPHAPFICIEPWSGHADPAGFTGEISDKPGIVLLGAGERASFRMDVTLRVGQTLAG